MLDINELIHGSDRSCDNRLIWIPHTIFGTARNMIEEANPSLAEANQLFRYNVWWDKGGHCFQVGGFIEYTDAIANFDRLINGSPLDPDRVKLVDVAKNLILHWWSKKKNQRYRVVMYGETGRYSNPEMFTDIPSAENTALALRSDPRFQLIQVEDTRNANAVVYLLTNDHTPDSGR